jgi:hypothetical protein
MADPVTWAYIAAYVAAGTAVASGYQQSQQADAEAELAQKNAEAAAAQASAAEDAQRRRSRSILARQRAAIAESGIGFEGSSERLQQESAVQAELDALNVRYEGRMRGMGYRADASFARSRSSNAMTGGYLSAAGSLLGGYSDAYAMKRT